MIRLKRAYELVIDSFEEDDKQFILNEVNYKDAQWRALQTMSESTYFRRKRRIAKQFKEKLDWYMSFR